MRHKTGVVMTQIIIIADDLSGAADCASVFVKAGLETLVVIDRDFEQDSDSGAIQVIAIDTDTRRLTGVDAARIHLDVFRRYCSHKQFLYKKIDSTLRGNFIAELRSIIDEAGLAIVAPAYPQAGRFTRNGHQFLNDIPLEETDIWKGEGITGSAHIPSMLGSHGIRAASISIENIRGGAQRLYEMLEAFAGSGVQALVCDAEVDSDLKAIAQASISLARRRFWVGSAGLASHIPVAAKMAIKPLDVASIAIKGSILTVVGSLSSVSRIQAEYLFSASALERMDIQASVLRAGQVHPDWQALSERLALLFLNGRDPLIVISADEPVNMAEGLRLCQALALFVAPHAEHIGAVISTGGETARAILSVMGLRGLRIIGEIESGVPISVAVGIEPIPIITKAGAFGTRETLLRCYETLRQARAEGPDKTDISLA
jgi:uncharacterized protein YgbK (DUF1537 family)